jgi:PTS system nitrogen regulatory IIA component
MQIEAILTPSRTLNKAVGGSKKRVLETLAQLIAEDQPAISAEDVFQSLIARERLGSTGIGNGIAIPHCRFPTDGSTLGALITLQDAVDFDSVDNAPVDIVFAMLVPENAEASHLQTLAALAEALQQEDYVEKLRSADSSEELYRRATSQ